MGEAIWSLETQSYKLEVYKKGVSTSRGSGLTTPVFSLLSLAAFLIGHPVHSNLNYEIPLRVSHLVVVV